MKLGGKKKLDTLIAILNESGPLRLQDLKDAKTLPAAQSAAKMLKVSAGSLGLARLEDLCDQIVGCKSWNPASDLIQEVEQAYRKGVKALLSHRNEL
jgi:HPt (histidine-containing phosphotransfer) domain-containing protein